MARPREFEIDDVLRNAMEAFWKRGYVATSMSDIYEATGLKPGNLYANFKDKDALFRRAFETYTKHFRASLPSGLSGRAAIEEWLRVQYRLAVDDPERKGCLIVNTITEREAHSEATREMARERLAEIAQFFRTNLTVAAERGEIDGSNLARLEDGLVGAVVAIMSLARAAVADSVIKNVADQAIATLRKVA